MTWCYVCFSISILIGFSKYTFGQTQELNLHLSDSILNKRGEVYFSFDEIYFKPQLDNFLSIEDIRDSKVYAYANKDGFNKFVSLNINFNLQPKNFHLSRYKNGSLDDVYPSYSQYVDIMEGFENKYNNLCELHEAGLTVQGRKLLMLKISSPSNQSITRPAVLLTSSIHGDELTGFKLLLWLIEYLADKYGEDPFVTKLIDETEIWINPLANPDGTYFGGNNTVVEATRFNANSLDINRNFPDPSKGDHPDNSEWQPETVALMEFMKQKKIVLSATLHTGNKVINYPWDTWSRLHPDDSWYKLVSRQYVDLVHERNNLYMTNFNNGIVNGYLWYRITGGKQDYMNYYLYGREVTIELSEEGMPDLAQLTNYWEYNRESLLRYLEQSLFGIQGKVTDMSNNPLNAKVEVINYDKDNSWVYSDATSGVFYRFLASGEYSLQVTAPGYNPAIVENVNIADGVRTKLDVKLEKNNTVSVSPNPFTNYVYVYWEELINKAEINIAIYNVTGRAFYKRTMSNNTEYPLLINLPNFPKGTYFIEIKAFGLNKTFKLIKQ